MTLAWLRLSRDVVFDSTSLAVDTQTKAVHAGLSTTGAQMIVFAIQMASTMVLARLLTPADYGLFGMLSVTIGLAAIFKSFGLSAATQQKRDITPSQVSALFWVNVVIGLALTICVAVAAPFVAWFFDQPRLSAATIVLSLTFVVAGLSVQHDALLRRHMRFTSLALLQIFSLLCGSGVSVGLALAHFGYWALVYGTLATTILGTIGTLFLCPWMPSRPMRGTGARGMLGFGLHVTGFELVNYFSRNLDNILIGRYIGATALGLYSKAYRLFMLPITQIRIPVTQFALPLLSSMHTDAVRFARYYQRLTEILATLVVPLTAFAFIEADFLIRVFLGAQWGGAASLFRILAIAGLVQGVSSTTGLVLLSRGQSRRYLRLGAATAVVMVVAFVAGLPFGVAGVAVAYTIANYVVLVPSLWYAFSGTDVTVRAFMGSLWIPLAVSALAAGLSVLVRYLLGLDSTVANLAACVVFLGVYGCVSSFRPLVRDTARRVRKGLPLVGADEGADMGTAESR